MKIDKIYNNNVVQTSDASGQELIVMGRGLAFGKKVGDELDQDKVERTFVTPDIKTSQEWHQLHGQLSSQEIEAILQVISRAEAVLAQSFELPFYLALADHLHYAIERQREGLTLGNPLAWEIRKFYPVEFDLGKETLAIVADKVGVELEEDEAASLALHFVNAQRDNGLVTKNQKITQLVMAILDIVRLYYGQEQFAQDNSFNYNRFVTHVQYFAQRVINGLVQGSNDAFLYEQVQANYPQAFACTQRIKKYVQADYQFLMSQDEEVYLTIHIQRVISAA